MEFEKKEFEKLVRVNAFHGCANLFLFLAVLYFALKISTIVLTELEINELWKWVFILPFGIWFCGWIKDK